jgi:hypothetical protein
MANERSSSHFTMHSLYALCASWPALRSQPSTLSFQLSAMSSYTMKLLSIFGTWPEAIKMAPIRKGLEPHPKNEPNTKFTRMPEACKPLEGLPASGGFIRRLSCPPYLWRSGVIYPPSFLSAVLVAEWRDLSAVFLVRRTCGGVAWFIRRQCGGQPKQKSPNSLILLEILNIHFFS